jgi:hypothetical protein
VASGQWPVAPEQFSDFWETRKAFESLAASSLYWPLITGHCLVLPTQAVKHFPQLVCSRPINQIPGAGIRGFAEQ